MNCAHRLYQLFAATVLDPMQGHSRSSWRRSGIAMSTTSRSGLRLPENALDFGERVALPHERNARPTKHLDDALREKGMAVRDGCADIVHHQLPPMMRPLAPDENAGML
jgi:hypothetical protein